MPKAAKSSRCVLRDGECSPWGFRCLHVDSSGQACVEFPKIGVPYFGVLIIRMLLFRALNFGPLFSETPMCGR